MAHHTILPGGDTLVIGRLDAHNELPPSRRLEVRPDIAVSAGIAKGHLLRVGLRPHGVKLLLRAIALICVSFREELLDHLLMPFDVPALSHDGTVVLHTKPIQALHYSLYSTLVVSFSISVLDAQLKLAAMLLCIHVAEKSRAGPSDVQVPCGRWCETSHNRSATTSSRRRRLPTSNRGQPWSTASNIKTDLTQVGEIHGYPGPQSRGYCG
mmetsp:Transcript_61410/g.132048  ORF Transcript_61410/g.132048 Transcript_61410/m.132048 type:complete len:211 (-) Transcript_61410:100-732(-)